MENLTRRDFMTQALLAGGALGLTGCTFNSTVHWTPPRPNVTKGPRDWKLGMQGAKTMNCGLGEELEILGRLGYDCIELRDWKLEAFLREWSIEELQRKIADSGVKAINISAIEMKSLGPGPARDKAADRFEWYFKSARDLGCRSAMFVHFAPMAPGELTRGEIIARATDDMRFMSDLAGKHGVMAIYEFLGAPNLPLHNIEDTMEVMERANRGNLGWIFDLYQFQVTDRSLEALARSNVKTLSVVHICDAKNLPYEKLAVPNSERTFPGEGICDTPEIMKTLARIGYKGPFMIELYNNEYMRKMTADEFATVGQQKTVHVLEKYYQPAIA